MKCSQIDYHSKDQLKKLKLEEYTTVSILAGSGEEAEESRTAAQEAPLPRVRALRGARGRRVRLHADPQRRALYFGNEVAREVEQSSR